MKTTTAKIGAVVKNDSCSWTITSAPIDQYACFYTGELVYKVQATCEMNGYTRTVVLHIQASAHDAL